MPKKSPLHTPAEEVQKLRIDIGCGKTTTEQMVAASMSFAGASYPFEWEGVDAIDFGQKHVHDVRKGLPFLKDGTVDTVRSSHFVEHLTGAERIAFFNELYRVMKVGAMAQITTPHWSHACAYGDPTHQWPPMSEWFALYLNKAWRDANAPHAAYTCDFDYAEARSWDQRLNGRNPEYLSMAMNTQVNASRDLIVTLTKR
jgi:hypothetical protein